MAMGYSAAFADTIEDKHVADLCPTEHKALMDAIEASGEDLESFAADAEQEDFRDEFTDETINLYKSLQKAFKKATGGATIDLAYHDSDNNGDRYDDISGTFWSVGGLTRPTKAAKFLGSRVEQKGYVVYG